MLALDSAGTLWGENSPGVLTQIATGLTANAAANSTSLFGREYISQHDGNFGVDIPRQFDGTNLDRVSQVGPAAGPTAITDVVANISAISRTSNVVTVATSTATGLLVTDQVTIAGVTDASYDGVFPVLSIIDSLHFTYAQTNANSSSSGGNAAPVGSISAGVHQCSVIFVTRQGYLTRPSPPISWTAVGGRRANVTGLPSVGTLPNVVARILAFTGAGGDLFYYTTGLSGAPQMQVFDNTLTSFVVDFSDTALLAGIEADYLFNLVELGECAGVIGYSDRLFWWGERNKQNNWDNLTFDGGFGGSGNNVPLGWTPDPTFFAGGTFDSSGEAVWGGALFNFGRWRDGHARVDHAIGGDRLQRRAAPCRRTQMYSARVRVRMTGTLTQGTLHVHLYSVSAGISTPGISVPAAQITSGAWKEFIAPITPASGISDDSGDLVLRVYADGTPT